MKQKMLLDYLKSENIKIYDDCDDLENISVAGEWVFVTECSSCVDYKNTHTHTLALLDVVAWVYTNNHAQHGRGEIALPLTAIEPL